ncbi:unnamed protein product [Cercopithifilaria johnstoni]|uniref:Apple domain-containing protein n=1 Tax=Cercopithifilaria johnstoni TaxID=2874296 RepID=A0A8J2Q9N8_9BILA|nr:unnamed protein product [Cercopithifilaria johnstoni]
MTIAVNFIDSSLNLLLFLILSLSAVGDCKTSINALKPCFERYIGQRLSDLSPYHIEWRMKTPEECLLFCALSSSRCRSVVHDIFQHICYYFLDDGQHNAQIARGMVYFRVIDKKCIDQILNGPNITFLDSEFAISKISSFTSTTTSNIELQRPALAYANLLIHIPPDGRAITPSPYFDSFDNQKKPKYEKFDEVLTVVATSPTTISDNFQKPQYYTMASANSTTTSTSTSLPTSFSKILSERDEIYDEEIVDSELSSPTFSTFSSRFEKDSINSTSERPKALQHETFPSDNASFFIGNIGNLPLLNENFWNDRQKDGVDLNKQLKAVPKDVRRSPIKTSLISAEKLNKGTNEMITLLNAENSIAKKLVPTPAITSIKSSKQNNNMERPLSSGICESNDHEVWLIVENAILQIDKFQKKTSIGSYKSCRAKCNHITSSGRECTSFTYDEAKRHCAIYTNNGDTVVSSLAFLPSPESDFKIRTAIKFCFPEDLIVFEKCSESRAFLDYNMNIEPREIFDNIPGGYYGLLACIELCFLASHFHCKSAAFNITLDKCMLYDENSLSNPQYFQKHQQGGMIYFENGCK